MSDIDPHESSHNASIVRVRASTGPAIAAILEDATAQLETLAANQGCSLADRVARSVYRLMRLIQRA